MAVKTLDTTPTTLTLELSNGEKEKFEEILKTWKFKDIQSMLRFMISILVLNENKFVTIKMDGKQSDVAPKAESLQN